MSASTASRRCARCCGSTRWSASGRGRSNARGSSSPKPAKPTRWQPRIFTASWPSRPSRRATWTARGSKCSWRCRRIASPCAQRCWPGTSRCGAAGGPGRAGAPRRGRCAAAAQPAGAPLDRFAGPGVSVDRPVGGRCGGRNAAARGAEAPPVAAGLRAPAGAAQRPGSGRSGARAAARTDSGPGAEAGALSLQSMRLSQPGVLLELPGLYQLGQLSAAAHRGAGGHMNRDPDRQSLADIGTVESTIGNTPLVRLQRIPGPDSVRRGNVLLAKLEGNNPGGSVKDRPALSMIRRAQERGEIKPGDRLIEATSGNTGIALAMIAAMRGFRMTLIMPDNLSAERRASMRAYGAELILTPASKGGMEYARDLASQMQARGEGRVLDQFANPDNSAAHYETTGPELWRDTDGGITHFVSSMGTTGTIMGVSRFLKQKSPRIQIVGAQPSEGSQIPGIRKWSAEYLPKIYDPARVDRIEYVTQSEAEEGIFCGISSGGALLIALRVAAEGERAVIVFVVCDRGDRYLSTSVFAGGA